jgi:hypothetical protein
MCLTIQLGIAQAIATNDISTGWSVVLMFAITVISSVTEPSVPREGRVAVTDLAENIPYTQRVVNLAEAILMPVLTLVGLISMVIATYGWLHERFPGLSAKTLASVTILGILAAVVVLVALVAGALALRRRRL